VAIYQTAYSRDESGFWTCGFQLSKDPGEPRVWLGSIVLTLAILLVFFVRFFAVGVVPMENGFRLVALTGFRGEAGAEKLRVLAAGVDKE
jgi:cytochrome c biogenesis protein